MVRHFGNPTGTIGGQGDIRPDPVLMPVPFATHGKAGARSEWLPLGVVGENLTFERQARPDGWLPFGAGRLLPETSGAGLLPTF